MKPPTTNDWIVLTTEDLSSDQLTAWATRPSCGAVVAFSGTVRDSSEGRDDIVALEYESDTALAESRIREIIATARSRWPSIVAVGVHHRIGRVDLSRAAVVVVVSAPHRGEAFDAGRFCIDTLKETVPIYKRDLWPGGSSWSSDTHEIVDVPKA